MFCPIRKALRFGVRRSKCRTHELLRLEIRRQLTHPPSVCSCKDFTMSHSKLVRGVQDLARRVQADKQVSHRCCCTGAVAHTPPFRPVRISPAGSVTSRDKPACPDPAPAAPLRVNASTKCDCRFTPVLLASFLLGMAVRVRFRAAPPCPLACRSRAPPPLQLVAQIKKKFAIKCTTGYSINALLIDPENPIEIIKWKEIFEGTETLLDICEDVANVIESILVKQG